MPYTPGDLALPATTPGGLATGVNGERLGSTDIAANGTKGQPVAKAEPIKLNIKVETPSASTLRYPSDPPILDESSDYVMFSFYNYAPPFGSSVNAPNGGSNTSTTPGYANYSSSSDRSYANPAPGLSSVILYMPEDIQAQFGAGWNGAGFGAAAAGMLNLTGIAGPGQDFASKIQAGVESIPGSLKAATFSAMTEAINKAAGANINLNQTLNAVTGTIINPNVEMMYEAPKLRNFSLRFKMSPRSGTETSSIRKICNTFKKAMLPSFGGPAIFGAVEAANLLTVPPLCQVNFMKGSEIHPYMPKFKLCGITDVNINYTADGAYATFNDGAPVSTELTLSFLESKLVFSDEVEIDGGGI